MDAADSSMGKLPVTQGSPVLVGAASQIQNAQDLAPEIELDAETGWFVEVFTAAPPRGRSRRLGAKQWSLALSRGSGARSVSGCLPL
jgi:hypothetical protein